MDAVTDLKTLRQRRGDTDASCALRAETAHVRCGYYLPSSELIMRVTEDLEDRVRHAVQRYRGYNRDIHLLAIVQEAKVEGQIGRVPLASEGSRSSLAFKGIQRA